MIQIKVDTLVKNTEWKNQKSWSLRFYIEELIPDIKEKII